MSTDRQSFTDLLGIASKLAAPHQRADAARELANAIGGSDLVIFIRDPEIDTFVAAPGFHPPIPSGKIWREFLSECAKRKEHTAQLPFGRIDQVYSVTGIAPTPDAVLVVIGTASIAESEWINGLLPLFAAMLRGEQAAVVASANARLAADFAARADAMAKVLSQSRVQLEEALTAAEAARSAAVEANRVKSQFLATMSHELRTPLNAIGGYSQLLAMGIHGAVTTEQKETLHRIDRSQRHLLGLINEILNLARLEAGKIDYEITRVGVHELMQDISPMIEPQLSAKGLHYFVRVSEGIYVSADREKLQQIMLNLLSNAVKFTEAGGKIDVKGYVEGSEALIAVSDTGRGIPADKIHAIFEPFTQVDARHSRTEQGAGLGLAISRDLARGMQGDVTVTSEIGTGSTFTVRLPAAQ